MQGFGARKRLLCAYPSPFLRTASILCILPFHAIATQVRIEPGYDGWKPGWSRGHKARGQGHKKKSEAKAKDSLSEDRPSRGQGQECSRPRRRTKDTSASALQRKKRSSQKFFKRSPQKNVFQKIFQVLHKILTIQKIVLSSSRGQANFR